MSFVRITQEKYQEIEKEIIELRRDKKSLSKLLSSKNDYILALEKEVQKNDDTIKMLSNELEMSAKEYEELLEDLDKLEADNEGLRKEISELRRKINEVSTIEKLEKIETDNKEYEAIEEKDLNKFRHNINNKIESIDTKIKARISKSEALVESLKDEVNRLGGIIDGLARNVGDLEYKMNTKRLIYDPFTETTTEIK